MIIYEISVNHTGTWFLLEFFKKHPEVHEVLLSTDDLNQEFKQPTVVHCHVRSLPEFSLNPIKPIVPVRDPVKAIITRQIRHPEGSQSKKTQSSEIYDHRFIVDGFVEISKIKDAFYFPIDLYETQEERYKLLTDMCNYVGLSCEYDFIHEVSVKWSKENYTPSHSIKDEYEGGKVPIEFAPIAFNYLIEKEIEIRPFLEQLGYTNLPWYT